MNRWYRQITIIGGNIIDSYATYTDGNIKALQDCNGFIKLNDNSWLYFNGNSIKKSSFNELLNHKNLEMLFYTTE